MPECLIESFQRAHDVTILDKNLRKVPRNRWRDSISIREEDCNVLPRLRDEPGVQPLGDDLLG